MAIEKKLWGKTPEGKELFLYTITAENGTSVQLGSLGAAIVAVNVPDREGKLADILIIDTDSPAFLSPAPFLSNLIYSAHSDCIESVIAGGKFVMRNRRIEGEKEMLRQAREILRELD